MPLVVVKYNQDRIREEILKYVAEDIQKIVATNLDSPDCPVKSSDVSVWFQDRGKFDIMTRDIEVLIYADESMQYDDSDEVARNIARSIHESTPCGLGSIWVWIRYAPLGFFQTR
jgi:hypothetical protein